MKMKKIMYGVCMVTVAMDGLLATIDIFNRKTNETAKFFVDEWGTVSEKTNIKTYPEALIKAYGAVKEYRKEILA